MMDALPGGSSNEEICFSRLTLVGYYRECESKKDVDKMHYLCNKVEKALRVSELSSDIKSVLSKMIYAYKQKLETSHKNYKRCINANKDWFQTYITFPIPHMAQKRSSGPGGRPIKDFEDCAERTKRKKTEDFRKTSTPAELAFAAQMEYRATGEIQKAKLIKDISLGRSSKPDAKPHSSYTPDKALSIFIESQLTKHQYNLLRKSALELNCHIYPNYESVTEAKKKCYPEGVVCSETKAEVPLQNLLNKTAERLLLSLREVILHLRTDQRQNLCLISKCGCDGSGSHSQYKQKFEDKESSDENMMVTSIVPIHLLTTNNVLIWQNPRPSSPRYCRPLRLQMAHETSELSRQEAANLQLEITNLLPTINDECCVKHELKFTMVDGKMINALTDTSSAMRCYLCNATSKDFNKLNVCLKKQVKTENLEFGISSLHAWIRLAECILHLAYKLKLAKWQARGEREKAIVAAEKKRIQDEFLETLGLHVDKPRQGGGTSTDGNTARIMFQHAKEVSKITGVNLNIINRFHTVLKLLSCGYKIHTEKFRKFCLQTASAFVINYPWFNMPTTLHKILIHGHQIIDNMGIAIGLLSEDAQESRNKDIRKYREQFSRKFSRKMAMEDTYHRLMVSSDPYITGLRTIIPKKTVSLSPLDLSFIDEVF